MNHPPRLPLFAGYGVEIEYMLVARTTLDVLPVADRLLHAVAGDYVAETEQGPLAWSNELALHVIELKTNGPAPDLAELPARFHADVRRINGLLEPLGGRLMPTAMHPWMDPHTETRLWPHEYNPIYQAYNRIFDCRGHGWSNLQSMHLNLPFADDAEFARLHAAIRLLLPILPALAASSPFAGARRTGFLDTRMETYRGNAARIPAITGQVVPETVTDQREYQAHILQPMYAAIAPLDPEGILQHEWLNSRGAIARFDRHAIEIRVLDTQECPRADLAIAAATAGVLRALVEERASPLAAQQQPATERLAALLLEVIRDGGATRITDREYLAALGIGARGACRVAELWALLLERAPAAVAPSFAAVLEVILEQGCLAERIVRAAGREASRERLAAVYRELCACLDGDRLFLG
jgi:gamma-glutamyl:cysteine ligase YbdK (ATP-grasp superfamily)